MNDDLREYRASVMRDVRAVMGQYVYLKMLRAGGASAADLEKISRRIGGAATNRMSDEESWCLTIGIIVTDVDRDLRARYGLLSACKLYVHREVFGETWSKVVARAKCSTALAKDIVAAATASIYAHLVTRGV